MNLISRPGIKATLTVAGLCLLEALNAIPASANTVNSSCWRMTNSQYYEAGMGPGINWKILGGCWVTLDSQGEVQKIELIKPSKILFSNAGTNLAFTKPYQNPTGLWMIGIWETNAKRSAIFATKTWGN